MINLIWTLFIIGVCTAFLAYIPVVAAPVELGLLFMYLMLFNVNKGDC